MESKHRLLAHLHVFEIYLMAITGDMFSGAIRWELLLGHGGTIDLLRYRVYSYQMELEGRMLCFCSGKELSP